MFRLCVIVPCAVRLGRDAETSGVAFVDCCKFHPRGIGQALQCCLDILDVAHVRYVAQHLEPPEVLHEPSDISCWLVHVDL